MTVPNPLTTPGKEHPAHEKLTRRDITLNLIGAALIIVTYTWAMLTAAGHLNYTDYNAGTAEAASIISLPLTAGYVLGAILILLSNINRISLTALTLIPFGAALNIIAGQITGSTGIPLYLDSLATIALGFLYGPAVGAMTGIVTNIIWGLTINPTTIPFAAGSAAIGLLAGLAGRYGLTKKLWAIIPAGFITGIIAGLIGAPVAAFVYGGGQGLGTGTLVATLQATGQTLLGATTLQSLISDPLDKTIAFTLAWIIIKAIPQRTLTNLNTRA